ncbi:MAG: hypothetical protein ACPGTG_08565, partial [Flavobacteriales bacterium]
HFFAVVFSLAAQAQTLEPVYNYITPYGSNQVKIQWEFESTFEQLNIDSFTYELNLENADETSSYYQVITAPVFESFTFFAPTDSVIWDPVLGDSTFYNILEYHYTSETIVPVPDRYYTYDVIYGAVLYDKLLGTGVNYYYDELKYNPSYPKPPFAIIFGGSDYHLPNNQFSYVINQTEPDFIAYKTTLNQSTSQFGFPLMYFFGPSDPPNQPSGYPYSSLLIGTEDVSTTILLTHPDTVPDLFYIDAADYNYKSYFFYPVYNQEICLGDQFEVNGEVVVSSGLYLDSL